MLFWGLFPVLSTFARIYFQAHFLGDVLSGHAIAAAVAVAFLTRSEVIGTPADFTWAAMAVWEVPVIVGWALCQKLKPKSAENIYNADNFLDSIGLKSKSKST